MSELDTLEQSIDASIKQINAASETGSLGADDSVELNAENARLKAELESMTARRKADLAELDDLLAQLKPMMEEG